MFCTIILFQSHLGSIATGSEQESSVSWEWWKPSQPGFNHFFWSQVSPEPWQFVSCRKQSCFEMFMRLRRRENASCWMYCVFRKRLKNCSLSFSPQSGHGHVPGFPWMAFYICGGTKIAAYCRKEVFPVKILSYRCFIDKIFTELQWFIWAQ